MHRSTVWLYPHWIRKEKKGKKSKKSKKTKKQKSKKGKKTSAKKKKSDSSSSSTASSESSSASSDKKGKKKKDNKNKKDDKDKEKVETPEEKAKREQKELEAAAKETKKKALAASNKAEWVRKNLYANFAWISNMLLWKIIIIYDLGDVSYRSIDFDFGEMFWPGCEQTAEFPGEGLFGGSQSWCHVPASAQSLLTCSFDILKKNISSSICIR